MPEAGGKERLITASVIKRLATLTRTVAGKEINIYDKHCLSLTREEWKWKKSWRVPSVIRQNNPTEGTTTFHDEIYGDITVDNAELDDMISSNPTDIPPIILPTLWMIISQTRPTW